MAKFAAFAVDINRTGLARYDLTATEKESAEQEARQYLERHQVIEVWSNDHRRAAREEIALPRSAWQFGKSGAAGAVARILQPLA